MRSALPSFLVVQAGSTLEPLRLGVAAHALDVFRLSGPHASGGQWAVVGDDQGQLALVAAAEVPPALRLEVLQQEQLAPMRHLDVRTLHLMAIDAIEAGADLPGLNDPLRISGRLFGPFPSAEPKVARVSLASTRADVLQGLVQGFGHAFHVSAPAAEAAPPRYHHLMLAGDEEPLLRLGRGVVLAYPLLATSLELGDAGNEHLVKAVLHKVLTQLRGDPAATGTALEAMPVPVANRGALEASLEARGFTVEGTQAERQYAGLFGALFMETVPVPPEGTLAEFGLQAQRTLQGLARWPTASARSLAERLRTGLASWERGLAQGLTAVSEPNHGNHDEQRGEELVSTSHRRSWSLRKDVRLAASWRPVYFVVDRAYARWNVGVMVLELELFDSAPGDVFVDYESGAKLRPASAGQRLTGERAWRTLRFELPGAHFEGRQVGGAGLRFCVQGPRQLRIRRIVLRPETALLVIEPAERTPTALTGAPPQYDGTIDAGAARHEMACSYTVDFDCGVPSDSNETPRRSTMLVFEDDVPLGPAHSVHQEIRAKGAGRFSHWGSRLYFSSSDNSDPRSNGRRYTFRKVGAAP